jgi:hypothetical protein
MHDQLRLTSSAPSTCSFSGMDDYNITLDQPHFIQYPKPISYNFNSRGFRDTEWPDDNLSQMIWCVGDSFTMGLGQPFNEIWCSVLKTKTQINTINISMNGASNNWIARKINYITSNIAPEYLVVQWSYIHRRESSDTSLPDFERKLNARDEPESTQYKNFIECLISVERCKKTTKIIHTFIPNWNSLLSRKCKVLFDTENVWHGICNYNNIEPLLVLDWEQLDYARDKWHYDIQTSNKYVRYIMDLL